VDLVPVFSGKRSCGTERLRETAGRADAAAQEAAFELKSGILTGNPPNRSRDPVLPT